MGVFVDSTIIIIIITSSVSSLNHTTPKQKTKKTTELNNGRLAMIAIAGFVVQELVENKEIFQHWAIDVEKEIFAEEVWHRVVQCVGAHHRLRRRQHACIARAALLSHTHTKHNKQNNPTGHGREGDRSALILGV